MVEKTGACALLLFLAWMTREDVTKQSLPLAGLGLMGGLGMLLYARNRPFAVTELVLGMAVGGALLLFALLKPRQIGKGDGWLFCVTGIFLGGSRNFTLLFFSVLFAGVTALLLLLLRHRKREDALPFVPFVLAAYLWVFLI